MRQSVEDPTRETSSENQAVERHFATAHLEGDLGHRTIRGGALTLGTVRDHFKLSLIASAFKLLALPLIGYGFLVAFGVTDLGLKIGLIYITLPTSPALYILSSQLNSDTNLASASIALSKILSFISLSIALLI